MEENKYRIVCLKAGCGRDATRILHWSGYTKEPWMLCDDHAEAALALGVVGF